MQRLRLDSDRNPRSVYAPAQRLENRDPLPLERSDSVVAQRVKQLYGVIQGACMTVSGSQTVLATFLHGCEDCRYQDSIQVVHAVIKLRYI
jgi:hypothetical protein